MLSIDNHRRDSAGLRYIYPVVSRRAQGVSIGVNLNPNNACNWACIYCQVENLKRGGPPPLDLALLERELDSFLRDVLHGDFMSREVLPEARRLVDVAFSGNGEPTSAPEFKAAVATVCGVLSSHALLPQLKVRLITNGSLLHRPDVQSGLRLLAEAGGEVWFKVDRVSPAEIALVNGVRLTADRILRNLKVCVSIVPTWLQTCWFAIDAEAPGRGAEEAYCKLLGEVAPLIEGVHLYGLARPSQQSGGGRLSRLTDQALEAFACEIKQKTGVKVIVSP